MTLRRTVAVDVLLALAVGLALARCAEDPVPSPVAAPESAASSGCAEVSWSCCRIDVEAPSCRNGTLTCRDGFETCELGDAGP